MLGEEPLIASFATINVTRPKSFYQDMLRLRLVAKAVCFSLALIGRVTAGQASSTLTTGLTPGPLLVGFHREWVLDPSRVWELSPALQRVTGTVARPLRIDVWYPSQSLRQCRRAALRDYFFAQPPSAYFAAANQWIQNWDENSYRGYARNTNSSFERIMALRASACIHASVRAGRHPLIIYSGGWYNHSDDNATLAEYLASYGYVVAEIPLLGAGYWTGDLSSNAVALETQTRDVEVALGALSAHSWIDRTRIAAMGYSSGGIVALFLQGRQPLIRAVIGLDPSYGEDVQKVKSSPDFGMYRNNRPILTLRSGNEVFTVRARDSILDSLHLADRYTADLGRSAHGDFSDDVVVEAALALARPGEPRTTAEGIAAYRAMCAAIRQFLDGTLRGQTVALDSLIVPRDSILRMRKTPAAPIPSSAGWIARVEHEDVSAIARDAEQLAQKYPGVTIVIERDLNRAGYRLLREGDKARATHVFRFNAMTHPNSANTYDSLAEACEAAADKTCARSAYQDLLRVLPSDPTIPGEVKDQMRAHAEARLRTLRGT